MLRMSRAQGQVLLVVLAVLLAGVVYWVQGGLGSTPERDARPGTSEVAETLDPDSGLPTVEAEDLPKEARKVLSLIDRGGPFLFPRHDGKRFENREGHLPQRRSGHYREYTVPTPGEDDRGARRIVCGAAGECYWTEDHYDSFERIAR